MQSRLVVTHPYRWCCGAGASDDPGYKPRHCIEIVSHMRGEDLRSFACKLMRDRIAGAIAFIHFVPHDNSRVIEHSIMLITVILYLSRVTCSGLGGFSLGDWSI